MDQTLSANDPRALVSERVFSQLLAALLDGRYQPGEKLPNQRALAAELGVTMSSLREALKRLEQMGLVDVRHGDAMRVRDWQHHGGLELIVHLLLRSGQVDLKVFQNLFEVRTLVIEQIAGLAAQRRSEEQAQQIIALANSLETAQSHQIVNLDFSFFAALAAATGNLVFTLLVNEIREVYFAHLDKMPVTGQFDELLPLYREIAFAVNNTDPTHAQKAAKNLAQHQWNTVISSLHQEEPA